MKIAFSYRDRLRDGWEKANGALIEGLDQLYGGIIAGYGTQHNPDDTHSTITATGSISERKRTVPMGEWITPAFNAANFKIAGAGNSWTVPTPTVNQPVAPLAYTLIGKTMILNIDIEGATLVASGTATNTITVAIPDGYLAAAPMSGSFKNRNMTTLAYIKNGGTNQAARLNVASSGLGTSGVSVQLVTLGNFADDAGVFSLVGQLVFEVG